jgi:hypothetical protein
MASIADVRFAWPVSKSGYEWIDAHVVRDDWTVEKRVSRVLVPKERRDARDLWKGELENPLIDKPALFLQFAGQPADEVSFAKFAESVGPLTTGVIAVPTGNSAKFPRPPGGINVPELMNEYPQDVVDEWLDKWQAKGAVFGETFEHWDESRRRMRFLMRLWFAVDGRDPSQIEPVIKFRQDKHKCELVLGSDESKVMMSFSGSPIYRPGSLLGAAEFLLKDGLSTEVGDSVRVALPPYHEKHWAFTLEPDSLIGAMWIQFALAVSESKKFIACEVCGEYIQVAPGVANSNRTLCSDACKAKAHRQRRAKALALAAAGMKPRQIAKEVGSKLETVQKWLQDRKEK